MQCLFLGNLYETDAQNSILHVHFPFEIYRFICIWGGVRGRGNTPTQRCCLTKANTHFCVCSVNTEISKYWRCNKSKMVNGAQRETAAAEEMGREERREVCCQDFGRHREGWQISIQPRGGPQKLKQMLLARKSRQRSQYNDDKRATCGSSYRFHFKIYATRAFSLSM